MVMVILGDDFEPCFTITEVVACNKAKFHQSL